MPWWLSYREHNSWAELAHWPRFMTESQVIGDIRISSIHTFTSAQRSSPWHLKPINASLSSRRHINGNICHIATRQQDYETTNTTRQQRQQDNETRQQDETTRQRAYQWDTCCETNWWNSATAAASCPHWGRVFPAEWFHSRRSRDSEGILALRDDLRVLQYSILLKTYFYEFSYKV